MRPSPERKPRKLDGHRDIVQIKRSELQLGSTAASLEAIPFVRKRIVDGERERSSEDPTRRDFGFDRPQQLVPEMGFGIEDRAYGYSEYETYCSGLNVGNDDSRHFDEQQLYQGFGGWDADERPVDYGIEESFSPCGRYDIENGYSFQDAGLNFSDREYPRYYRSPSRERSRTFRPGPSFEPDRQ